MILQFTIHVMGSRKLSSVSRWLCGARRVASEVMDMKRKTYYDIIMIHHTLANGSPTSPSCLGKWHTRQCTYSLTLEVIQKLYSFYLYTSCISFSDRVNMFRIKSIVTVQWIHPFFMLYGFNIAIWLDTLRSRTFDYHNLFLLFKSFILLCVVHNFRVRLLIVKRQRSIHCHLVNKYM